MLPNQTPWRPEEMLERRLVVLRGILKSEEVYLRELDALLMVRLPNMSTADTEECKNKRFFMPTSMVVVKDFASSLPHFNQIRVGLHKKRFLFGSH